MNLFSLYVKIKVKAYINCYEVGKTCVRKSKQVSVFGL